MAYTTRMARVLIATVPSTGHVTPIFPLARALVLHGHDVRWLSGAKHGARITATGARYVPYRAMRDIDESKLDEAFPGRAKLRGLASITHDIKYVLIDPGLDQLHDLEALHASEPFDLLISDIAYLGAQLFHERTRVPLVVVNPVPLFITSRDVAPLGMALPPSSSRLGRVRNRALAWTLQNVILRDVRDHYRKLRTGLGLDPRAWFIDCHERASVVLQASIPGLEYPRSDLPHNVHFIGQLPLEPTSDFVPPSWFDELDGRTPVVHVTQGTIANVRPDLLVPALEGLAREDVLVVATTGGRPIEQLALGRLPSNARIATFIPHAELLPRTSAMITNGGFGGVQTALRHGVPLVVAGATEDKPEVAARVAYSGAGLNLRTGKPTARAVRTAVRKLLADDSLRRRARELSAEYARYDSLALALSHVERLI